MCECIVQNRDIGQTLAFTGAVSHHDLGPGPAIGSAMTPASTPTGERLIKPKMRLRATLLRDGRPIDVNVRWGWSPEGSMGTRAALTHLDLEQVMRSSYHARLRHHGRALVPVEGWYDQVRDLTAVGGRSRLGYVTARQAGPVYLAALAQVGLTASGCDGLALVTHTGEDGGRQVLVLEGEAAQAWLAADLQWPDAQRLAREAAVGHERLAHLLTAPASRGAAQRAAYA